MRNSLAPVKLIGGICMRSLPSGQEPFAYGSKMGRRNVMFTILVCDDEKDIVDAIEIYLAQEGYRVLKAYDGLQALEILKTEEVHLILLDVMMPKLDGIHTMMKIRETSSVPIIVLSAKSQDTRQGARTESRCG